MTKRRRLSKINRKKLFKTLKKEPGTKSNIWFPVILLSIVVILTSFFPHIKPFIYNSSQKIGAQQPTDVKTNIQSSNIIEPQKENPIDSTLIVKNKKDTINQVKSDSIKNVKTGSSAKKETKIEKKKVESPKPSPKISCQILNGCGTKGITNNFKKYLENKGHTINSTGNYKSFRIKKSFIISQKKNDDPYILAKELNIPKSRIQIRKVKSSSKLIFVIGKDYKSLPPFKKQ